jgi:hypothetical protein
MFHMRSLAIWQAPRTGGELEIGVCAGILAFTIRALHQIGMPDQSVVRSGPVAVLRCNIQAGPHFPYPKAEIGTINFVSFEGPLTIEWLPQGASMN